MMHDPESFAALADLLRAVLWESHPAGAPIRVSGPAREVLGAPAEHWGDPEAWLRAVHPDDWAPLSAARAAPGEPAADHRFRLRGPDGVERTLCERLAPLPGGGARGVIRDITDEANAQSEGYQALMEQAPDAILILQPDGTIVRANACAADLYRVPLAELPGRNITEWVDPEQLVRDPLRIVRLRTGETLARERSLRLDDGTQIQIEVRAKALEDGTVQAIVRDLTPRLHAEEALRDSEARFRALFENSAVGMTVASPEGLLIECNPAFAEMLGRPLDQLRGHSFQEFTHPDDREPGQRRLEELRSGQTDRFAMEKRYVRPDGRVIWVRLVCSAVRTPDGQLSYQVNLVEDVTARRAALEALQLSEQRFQELASVVRDVLWIADADDRLLYLSPAFATVWGRPVDPLLHDPALMRETLHPEDVERLGSPLVGRLHAEATRSYRIVRPDGGIRWIRDRTFPVRDGDGRPVRVVGVAEDVTERAKLEEQLHQSQKMEAVGKLAGGIAHDFNNLLTSISGNAELLLMDLPPGDPMREDAQEIVRASGRAAELTRQLLAFSRRQVLQLRGMDLNQTVQEMQRMLRRLIDSSVDLRVQLSPRPLPVHADPGQLEQVVLNLVVNARDATPSGGRISVSTSEMTVEAGAPGVPAYVAPGDYARLEVVDTGSGMDELTRDRIFEPFFTTKEHGKGTGLGLSTVYGIVKQSSGFVYAESEAGRGSRFVVLLPRTGAVPDAQPAARPVEERPAAAVVLVVDDEPAVRALACRSLAGAGFTVLEAGSVGDGIEAARSAPRLDLLLADVVMPDGGGPALADVVMKERPEVALMFMSGYVGMVSARLPDGADLVNKPFSPSALVERVKARLARNAVGP